jgi:hypothetical protein
MSQPFRHPRSVDRYQVTGRWSAPRVVLSYRGETFTPLTSRHFRRFPRGGIAAAHPELPCSCRIWRARLRGRNPAPAGRLAGTNTSCVRCWRAQRRLRARAAGCFGLHNEDVVRLRRGDGRLYGAALRRPDGTPVAETARPPARHCPALGALILARKDPPATRAPPSAALREAVRMPAR